MMSKRRQAGGEHERDEHRQQSVLIRVSGRQLCFSDKDSHRVGVGHNAELGAHLDSVGAGSEHARRAVECTIEMYDASIRANASFPARSRVLDASTYRCGLSSLPNADRARLSHRQP